MRFRNLTAALALAAWAAPAMAQEAGAPAPLTWVSYNLTKPGKLEDLVKMTLENDAPLLDKLMKEGTVRSWGLATPINHRPGFRWNVMTWVTVGDWASVGKWAGATMQQMMATPPDQMKKMMDAAAAIEEGRPHFDDVSRNAHISQPKTPGKLGYFYVGHFQAKPGQAAAALDIYKEAIVPVAEKLQAEGVLSGYGLHVQELHGQFLPDREPWTHRAWYGLPDLAALDKLQAALDAALTPAIRVRMNAIFESAAHTDDVLMVLHVGGQAPPAPPAKK